MIQNGRDRAVHLLARKFVTGLRTIAAAVAAAALSPLHN